jgi:hypothetical protein
VLPGEAEWLVPETNEGAAKGFPKWGNKCNFTLEQQKAFVESPYKVCWALSETPDAVLFRHRALLAANPDGQFLHPVHRVFRRST